MSIGIIIALALVTTLFVCWVLAGVVMALTEDALNQRRTR